MSEERFERIEATLEQIGQRLAELAQRQEETQAQLDGQIPVIAELRTSIEVLRNTVESERAMTTELRQTAEALLGVAQVHQRDIEALANAFQQHRSDGHGADAE